MSLLSTLRPLSSRLYHTFSWILAYLSASGDRPTTLNDLNDDCLLLLLETLSVPQLLTLRGVSRRFSYLIEHYRLPMYKSLTYGHTVAEMNQRYDETVNSGAQSVSLYVSTPACSEFDLRDPKILRVSPFVCPTFFSHPGRLFPVRLSTFPPSLPCLLPRLARLRFTHFLVNFEEPLGGEQSTVNRILAHYLRSPWKDTLVSLHLYIHLPDRPEPDHEFFRLLNKLPALKCLKIEFSRVISPNLHRLVNGPPDPDGRMHCSYPDYGRWTKRNLLPNSLPVLSQLASFSLTNYGGRNTARLLAQLGPRLTYLSLSDVFLSVKQYTAFLESKPTYSQTLKTAKVESIFMPELSWGIFTLASQYLPSLEGLLFQYLKFDDIVTEDIVTFFTHLQRLPQLRELSKVHLSVNQLRAYRLSPVSRRLLPRLPTIRRLSIYLSCRPTETEESDYIDYALSLLASVFTHLDTLNFSFYKIRQSGFSKYSESQSLGLASLASQRFKSLRHCKARYSCPPVV